MGFTAKIIFVMVAILDQTATELSLFLISDIEKTQIVIELLLARFLMRCEKRARPKPEKQKRWQPLCADCQPGAILRQAYFCILISL